MLTKLKIHNICKKNIACIVYVTPLQIKIQSTKQESHKIFSMALLFDNKIDNSSTVGDITMKIVNNVKLNV